MLHDALGHFLFSRTIGPRNELQKEQCHKEEAFSNTSRVCIELRMRGSGPLQSIPDFDRAIREPRDDLRPIWRELNAHDRRARGNGARLVHGRCQDSWGASVGRGRREWSCYVPASHTLIVLSRDPETMVLPSGEKATESM